MSELEELKRDADEARVLLASATRKRLKDLLSSELQNIEIKLHDKKLTSEKVTDEASIATSNKVYTTTLRNYSWDQSDKFLKIYVTLAGVQNINQDNISCEFGKNSLELKILDLDGKNYELKISNLAYPINVQNSYHKVKTDMVVVFASKQSSKRWEAVTAEEKRILDAKKATKKDPSPDNPTAGLMDLMKQMYDDGDDETKRMLNKTWYESQKKAHSSDVDMPEFGDMKM